MHDKFCWIDMFVVRAIRKILDFGRFAIINFGKIK